jgi:hypothetical protein
MNEEIWRMRRRGERNIAHGEVEREEVDWPACCFKRWISTIYLISTMFCLMNLVDSHVRGISNHFLLKSPAFSPAVDFEDIENEIAEEVQPPQNPLLLFFNCCGATTDLESKPTDSIFIKDLQGVLKHVNFVLLDEISLFNFDFEDHHLPIDVLIQMARQEIQKLASSRVDSSSRVSTAFYSYRESVTKMMLCLRCHYQLLR